ncbi:DUF481 domain-containing protein [Paraurantiacibacter namhicola]|uniref:Salt-induced outer membrane protein n=1 Tax=Paraurantiacibacter namhicola TaxID=645517 RepID=A0A1C7D8U7_9SPHN|nr:hypothetical protein A6F65_01610 [Paraurantiacibacter namhicola]
MPRLAFLPLALAATAFSADPAHADVPEPVRAMIEAAIATGDADKVATVVELAKQTNPDDTAEIDAMHGAFLQQKEEEARLAAAAKEQELAEAGVLDNWSGEGQIGAFQSSGNTDSVGVSSILKLKREGLAWSHRMRLSADYQRTNGQTTREQFLASYEPRYQINDRLFAYGLLQYERDRFQGFSARYATSAGIGYKVIATPDMSLSIKAGPAFRRTEFVTGRSEDRLAGLVGLDFDWRISDSIKLTQDTNAVAETGGQATVIFDSSNTSLNLITGVEAKISDSLSARLSYAIEYDSNPPAGAVATDTLTRFTLVYGF